jgi:predicted DNA-binding protein (UPF0278 family)
MTRQKTNRRLYNEYVRNIDHRMHRKMQVMDDHIWLCDNLTNRDVYVTRAELREHYTPVLSEQIKKYHAKKEAHHA